MKVFRNQELSRILFFLFLHVFLAPTCIGAQNDDSPAVETGRTAGADSPGTRAEQLRQRRQEKQKQIEPVKEEFLEGFFKRLDQKGNESIEASNFRGFHPRIDWIARGSGVAGGVRYWKPEAWGPVDLMGSAFYSRRRYQHYDLQAGVMPNRGKRIPPKGFEREEVDQLGDIERDLFSRFKLYVSARFRDRTDESYYGQGTESKREERARYRVKDTLAEFVTGYQFSNHIGWTFKAGVLNHTLRQGRSDPPLEENFPQSAFELPGRVNPPNYFRYLNTVLFDFRDDPGIPRRGAMAAFGWERYDNINTGDLFNFHRFSLDARGYMPLGAKQRVLAVRGVFVNSDPAEGNQVPFFLQPSLGGGESLRGYDAFRFQGDKLLLAQAEYRWFASRRFEFAFFGDTGTVANQGQRISLDRLKSDCGIGFRFNTSRFTIFRLDQAWGNEGPRLQVRFSAVF